MQLSQILTYVILITRKDSYSESHETPWLPLDGEYIKAYLPLLWVKSLKYPHLSKKDDGDLRGPFVEKNISKRRCRWLWQ